MDLENFPTRETAKDMLSMISPIYARSYVGKWLFQVMSAPMELACKTVEDIKNQTFPETATWSLPWWEDRYGIETNEGISVEERRSQIVQKRNIKCPMNPYRIERLVAEISGREVKLHENVAPSPYQIEITDGVSACNYGKVISAVNKVKQSQKTVLFSTAEKHQGTVFFSICCVAVQNIVIT